MNSETAWLVIEGMNSDARAKSVQSALMLVGGVANVSISRNDGVAVVRFDPGMIRPEQFRAAVRAVGCLVDLIALPGDPECAHWDPGIGRIKPELAGLAKVDSALAGGTAGLSEQRRAP